MKTVDMKQQHVRTASTLRVYAKIALPLVNIECILQVYPTTSHNHYTVITQKIQCKSNSNDYWLNCLQIQPVVWHTAWLTKF